jgi:hypothetical protein
MRGAQIKLLEVKSVKEPENYILGESSPSVRESNGPDGAVLLDIQQGICFNLNPVGAKIWGLIKEHKSMDEIITSLVKEFDVPEEQIRADVMEFAALLKQNRLLLSAGDSKRSRSLRNILHRLISTSSSLREMIP